MAAVLGLGVWVGRRPRGIADYLLGGRNLPWWAVLFSIVATETSTVTFLSVPGVAFVGDLTFLQLPLGYLVGRYVVVYLLLPQYFRGELFTAYQVLDRRFGGATKQAASLLFIVTRSLADGLRLYLTALVLAKATGIGMAPAIIAMGLTTITYTFLGGMKAVVWTDCLQFFVYVIGAVLACAVIVARLPGGLEQLVNFAYGHDKFRLFDFSLGYDQSYTFAAGLLGGAFISLATHGTDQLMVQRYLSARTEREAGRALALSGWVVLAQFALFLLVGVALACFYYHHPPAVRFEKGDEVFASFIVQHLPVGLVGVTLAAVFSAAMSTLSSSLNSSATAAVNDLYVPLRGAGRSPARLLAVTRGLTVLFGLVQIGVGLGGRFLAQSVVTSVLAIASFTTGIILGVFLLGIVRWRVSQPAALIGLVSGLAGMTAVAFGTRLAWPWYAVAGSMGTFVIGLAAEAALRMTGRYSEGT